MSVQTSDPLSAFRTVAPSRAQFKRAESASVAEYHASADVVGTVSRGTHIKSEVPALFTQVGTTQVGLPLAAIGAAIGGDLLSADEILALCSPKMLARITKLLAP